MNCLDTASFSGKSILLAEDEAIVVDVMSEVFSDATSSFDVALNGVEAVEKIATTDYDYILLDIEMPRMDGREVYKFIKANKPYLLKNIVIITGDTETIGTRLFILNSGCRYIDKPFMLKDLIRVMNLPA